jgi:acetyl esterase/lipase
MRGRRGTLGLGAIGAAWRGVNLVVAAATCRPTALGRTAALRRAVRSRRGGRPPARRRGGPGSERARRVVTPGELAARFAKVEYGPGRTGWWSSGTAGCPAVVVAHGYCVSPNAVGSDASPVLELAADLRTAGHPVLAMTFGYATGAYPFGAAWREAEDVRAACAWVAAETGAPAVVWGFSAGAHAALLAAGVPGPVLAVISDSALVDLVEVVRSECGRRLHLPRMTFGPLRAAITLMAGAPPVDLSRRPAGAPYPVPALIVHAGLDEIIPADAAAILCRATGGQVWEVPGAAHTQGYRVARQAYLARVQQFLQEVGAWPASDEAGAVSGPRPS